MSNFLQKELRESKASHWLKVENIADHFQCSLEDAQKYLDFKAEGYSSFQAKLMAGLSDPPEFNNQ
jgi:hypothetical protein